MVDFQNHRIFSLRCQSNGVILVSGKFKNNIRRPGGYNITKKAERSLLNERVRIINNTLEIFEYQRETCILPFNQSARPRCYKRVKRFYQQDHRS